MFTESVSGAPRTVLGTPAALLGEEGADAIRTAGTPSPVEAANTPLPHDTIDETDDDGGYEVTIPPEDGLQSAFASALRRGRAEAEVPARGGTMMRAGRLSTESRAALAEFERGVSGSVTMESSIDHSVRSLVRYTQTLDPDDPSTVPEVQALLERLIRVQEAQEASGAADRTFDSIEAVLAAGPRLASQSASGARESVGNFAAHLVDWARDLSISTSLSGEFHLDTEGWATAGTHAVTAAGRETDDFADTDVDGFNELASQSAGGVDALVADIEAAGVSAGPLPAHGDVDEPAEGAPERAWDTFDGLVLGASTFEAEIAELGGATGGTAAPLAGGRVTVADGRVRVEMSNRRLEERRRKQRGGPSDDTPDPSATPPQMFGGAAEPTPHHTPVDPSAHSPVPTPADQTLETGAMSLTTARDFIERAAAAQPSRQAGADSSSLKLAQRPAPSKPEPLEPPVRDLADTMEPIRPSSFVPRRTSTGSPSTPTPAPAPDSFALRVVLTVTISAILGALLVWWLVG